MSRFGFGNHRAPTRSILGNLKNKTHTVVSAGKRPASTPPGKIIPWERCTTCGMEGVRGSLHGKPCSGSSIKG